MDSDRVCADILRRQIAELEAWLRPDSDLQRDMDAAEAQVRLLTQERAEVTEELARLRGALRQFDHGDTSAPQAETSAEPGRRVSGTETEPDSMQEPVI